MLLVLCEFNPIRQFAIRVSFIILFANASRYKFYTIQMFLRLSI